MPDKYTEEIIGMLTGTKFDIPRERIDWIGINAFINTWNKQLLERDKIISAMKKIIETSKDEGLLADLCYLAYTLKITSLRKPIQKLAKSSRGKGEIVREQIQIYLHVLNSNRQNK